ncbi:MAG: extracellular solute-binding protein family 1 [Paenibacillus sp.]|nr:extracellular solute-binding protein family 1 [Paenibacillus sp.]
MRLYDVEFCFKKTIGGFKMAKKMGSILAAVLLASTMTACSGGTKEEKSQPTAPKLEDNKPVELTAYLSGYTHERFMTTFGDYIQKKYPNITFKVLGGNNEKVPDLVAAGVKLDLIQSSVPELIIDNGLQDDLTDLIKKYNYDLNKLEPAVLDLIRLIGDGKIYGFPNGVATVALFYNKTLFNKFGISYPTNGMTWEQVFELAKRLTRNEGGVQYQGFVDYTSYIANANQMSQGYVDPKTGKATLNNANWRKFMDNFIRFYSIPGNPYIPAVGDINNAFQKEQRIAMYAGQFGAAAMTGLTNAGVDWGVVSLPEFAGYPGVGPGAQVPLFYVGKTAANRDWAFKAAAYLGSEEFQKESATKVGAVTAMRNRAEVMANYAKEVPAIPVDKKAPDAVPKTFAKPYAITPYDSLARNEFLAAYTAVAKGDKDANTALREAEEKANAAIEAAKKK